MEYPEMQGPVCPMPLRHDEKIVMGHGSGGKMSQDLIKQVFQSEFTSEALLAGNDFAYLAPPNMNNPRMVTSVDAHIVSPLFFPGGDIGKLAICGTVNDVSVAGAIPKYITAAFILEEGLPMELLGQITTSFARACEAAGVRLVTGDTKVVDKGHGDGLYINTSGIGLIPPGIDINAKNARPGDAVAGGDGTDRIRGQHFDKSASHRQPVHVGFKPEKGVQRISGCALTQFTGAAGLAGGAEGGIERRTERKKVMEYEGRGQIAAQQIQRVPDQRGDNQ